jgi:hypothetical protein
MASSSAPLPRTRTPSPPFRTAPPSRPTGGTTKETPATGPNLIPYVAVFAVLLLSALGLLSYVLSTYYHSHACAVNPNIWCFDTWGCTSNCTGGVDPQGRAVSTCFENATGPTGLASCLFGPNSAGATLCFTAPTGNAPGQGVGCDCPTGMAGASNCFAGCAKNLTTVSGQAVCCCTDVNNPACAVTVDSSGKVVGTGRCAL